MFLSFQCEDGLSVSSKEMHEFQKHVTEWWRPGGQYAGLRSLNKLRVPLIKKLLLSNAKVKQSQPLSGYRVLDVGCGGGILAEPIARLGANVLGIDPLQDSIDEAKHHALKDPDLATLSYECSTIEELAEKQSNCFDIVLASEVLQYVDSPDVFLHNCCKLIKPGGHLFVTTINRTLLSTIFVKYAAENLLRIVSHNSWDETKFITTDELTDMLRRNNMNSLVYRAGVLKNFKNRAEKGVSAVVAVMLKQAPDRKDGGLRVTNESHIPLVGMYMTLKINFKRRSILADLLKQKILSYVVCSLFSYWFIFSNILTKTSYKNV
ncbi:ubiquinone biosynthesis O-methyltransferase-like [Hydractinia symbiolongicarpus]|uniref:ubiquinone biosynthesis O-methyltransferase-like n=1 Tax=Hydractinia symbiolongicarpus TaxID=13093 RepID=UPI002549CAAA|nr:ubiquinone biosynthesis O-methyltransferase-like [Hydractinia symbiolongicarpus]